MPAPLPRCSVPARALLLLLIAQAVCMLVTAGDDILLENGNEFENAAYTINTTYDANAKLKDETAYSSTILWKSCTVSSTVMVKGTFDTTQTFATSLYLMIDSTTFTDGGQFYFNDLPPNSYIHAVRTTGTEVRVNLFDINPITESNNITTLIDDSTIQYIKGVNEIDFVKLVVPESSPYIVTHLRNAKLTNVFSIFSTTTCTKGSTIFLEKITCTKCTYDLIMLTEINSISEQSAIILKEITVVDHTHPTRDGLIRTGNFLNIDASSVLAVIDVDLTNDFNAEIPLRLFYSTKMSGAGAIVFLRIEMGSSGLATVQPADNSNFWVTAKKTAERVMTSAELKAVRFNVNTNNVINWDGTGSNGKCVQVGLALPGTATYELVNGKCEATCPKGNYLQPACTPRAECTGVPNCEACYAHPKDKCLECLPHTTPENSDTKCTCPIRECIECPTATLCTRCADGYKYSADLNACFQCTIDKCTLCNSDDQCATCEDGYKVHNNQCIACNLDKCELCKEAGKCAECVADHKPTADGKTCFYCATPYCSECSADGVCALCEDGYYLLESSTNPTKNKCVRCRIDVPNCAECKTDGICSTCDDGGYTLSSDGRRCTACDVDECQRCDLPGVCALCNAGMTATDGGQCTPCAIENCTHCSASNVCAVCSCGEVPGDDGEACVPCSAANCRYCDPAGGGTACAECMDGYEASDDGVCRRVGVADWVVFVVVVAVTIVLITAVTAVYVIYQRRLAKEAEMAVEAEERRRNRQSQVGIRQRMDIAILDLGDIENAASGVRDTIYKVV